MDNNDIVKKLNSIVLDEDKNYDDLMFWVECPSYQDEIIGIKDEKTTDSNGNVIRNITFLFDGLVEKPIANDLMELNRLIEELSVKEIRLFNCKEAYQVQSDIIIEKTDFKELYGKNNAEVRKNHVKNELVDAFAEIKDLEFSIDYISRRISFLKELVRTKRVLMEVKRDE